MSKEPEVSSPVDAKNYRVSKIHIKNFRGIKNETFEFNKNLTIIVGENGTYKTTILHAIDRSFKGFFLKAGVAPGPS